MNERTIEVAAATVPGAIHLRAGRSNQDAVRYLPPAGRGSRVVMAVSDGHGSAVSPRSGIGSTMAVDITTDVLWELPQEVSAAVVAAAVLDIVDRWTAGVRDHLTANPPTPAELVGSGSDAEETDTVARERPAVLYGATLLFAVISGAELVLGQLGDGDVVVVDDHGQASRPLPADSRLLAHVTTSLSDDDAVRSVRTKIVAAPTARLIQLSTDGLSNSYRTDDGFLQFSQDILRTVDTEGIVTIRDSLPGWLAETTRDGAGDDIGVAIAVLDPVRTAATAGHRTEPAARPG